MLWVYSDFGAATPLNQGDGARAVERRRGTTTGEFEVRVTAHGFDGSSAPAIGATIGGAESFERPRRRSLLGHRRPRRLTTLQATRGLDVPSQPLDTCSAPKASDCPTAHGRTIVGSNRGDQLKGTKGWDDIAARGGDDLIDIRSGGHDAVDCGGGRDLVRRKGHGGLIDDNCERVRSG